MSEKIKYASNSLFTLVGILWLFVALLNFAITLFLTMGMFSFIFFMPLFTCILSVVLGVYYLKITNRNYLVIDNLLISIDKGLIKARKDIRFKDICTVQTIGNKLRIGLKVGSEERINLDLLTIQDIDKLNGILETNI